MQQGKYFHKFLSVCLPVIKISYMPKTVSVVSFNDSKKPGNSKLKLNPSP